MEPLQRQQLPQDNKNMFSTRSNNIFIQNPNLKTLLLILMGVFLLSGIGLAIFAQWSANYREKIYEESQAALPKHQVKSATTILESGTNKSDSKTYKNDKYGFEFGYPANGVLSEYDLTDQVPYGDAPFCPNKTGLPGCLDLNIKFPDGSEFDYTYQTHQMGEDLADNIVTKQVLFLGKENSMLVDDRGNAAIHPDQETNIAFFSHGSGTDLSLFNKILSTFKFTK